MSSSGLQKDIATIDQLITYLELMAAILPDFEYWKMKSMAEQTRAFFRYGTKYEIAQRLPDIKSVLSKQAKSLMKDCPLKKDLGEVAELFNTLRNKEDIINTGIPYGFLNGLMDLNKFRWYSDMPHHYKIAIGPHKGNGGIEEEFLLKDAFVLYKKAEQYYELLLTLDKTKEITKSTYKSITNIKYEVACYSRFSVLAFYSFIECLVNSIGFDHLYRHEKSLTDNECLILKGIKKNGGYLNLKNRIESLQTVIRNDKQIQLKMADDSQRKEPFTSFFDQFEALRNASVHYSPIKHRIWMSPDEWIQNARAFCDISIEAGIGIWKACYPESDGPLYLGKLDKTKHLELAKERFYLRLVLSPYRNFFYLNHSFFYI